MTAARARPGVYFGLERQAIRLMRRLRRRRLRDRAGVLRDLAGVVALQALEAATFPPGDVPWTTPGAMGPWLRAESGILRRLACAEDALRGRDVPGATDPAADLWRRLRAEQDFPARAVLMERIAAVTGTALGRQGIDGVQAVEIFYVLSVPERRRVR